MKMIKNPRNLITMNINKVKKKMELEK